MRRFLDVHGEHRSSTGNMVRPWVAAFFLFTLAGCGDDMLAGDSGLVMGLPE